MITHSITLFAHQHLYRFTRIGIYEKPFLWGDLRPSVRARADFFRWYAAYRDHQQGATIAILHVSFETGTITDKFAWLLNSVSESRSGGPVVRCVELDSRNRFARPYSEFKYV